MESGFRRKAHISPHATAGLLADGVFETMKARNGKVFHLDRHLSRIDGALRRMDIPQPPELREWVDAAIRAAHLPEASIRLTAARRARRSRRAARPGSDGRRHRRALRHSAQASTKPG